MKKIFFLFCFMATCFFSANAEARNIVKERNENNCFVARDTMENGHSVYAEVCMTKVDKLRFKFDSLWGHSSSLPFEMISSLTVKVNGKPQYFRVSAFIDLAVITSIELDSFNDAVVLTLEGGGAGTHYFASISFRDGFAINRIVSHAIFGNVAWERTEYHYNNLPEMIPDEEGNIIGEERYDGTIIWYKDEDIKRKKAE